MAKKKLQGQVAIISGAGRGIGAATAELLAQAGAAVVLTARSADQVESVAARLRQAGGRAIAVEADVSDPEQVEEVVEAGLTQFDRIDILVNNAGVIWPLDAVLDADMDEWAYNIHVNLVAPFYMARSVLPVMLDRGYGRIVNVTSHAAGAPVPGGSAYCAAKAGLEMFTRVLAVETQGTGVTVNALRPGDVDTEMQADIRSVDAEEAPHFAPIVGYFQQKYEEGRLRSPGEVARAIYWLIGPWSRSVSGQVYDLDDETWRSQLDKDLT
jgi:NAD(P)-dependent dehydrogenase (short-subunit alcohol dehydrogenase family)